MLWCNYYSSMVQTQIPSGSLPLYYTTFRCLHQRPRLDCAGLVGPVPQHWFERHLSVPALRGDVEVLQILLDKSAPVKDAFAHSERVVRLLLRRAEIDVNAESPKHRTVL